MDAFGKVEAVEVAKVFESKADAKAEVFFLRKALLPEFWPGLHGKEVHVSVFDQSMVAALQSRGYREVCDA